MNKSIIVYLLFLFGSAQSHAQQYQPMLDSVNIWSFVNNWTLVSPFSPHSFDPVPCNYPRDYSRLYTADDTLVNAITYKKLYAGDVNQCLFGYIREDTASRKVYFQDVVDSPEVVLYDFSLTPGDSINIDFNFAWGNFFPAGTYRLDSITNIAIRVGLRRAFHLNCVSTTSLNTLTWIESVGNLGDVIYPYSGNSGDDLFQTIGCNGFPHDFHHFMSCFEHNEKVYYDSCAYQVAINNWCFNVQDTCNYFNICGGVTENGSGLLIKVYPNPVIEKFTIHPLEFTGRTFTDISIYNIFGGKVSPDFVPERCPDGDMLVECKFLPPGIYLLEVKNGSHIIHSMFVKSDSR